MQIHRGLESLPSFQNAVATIGSFDGVHHGHRKIIEQVISKATELKGESLLITFDPHPRQVVTPDDKQLKLLNSLDEKISLLEKTGLDHLIIIPFSIEFSQISPKEYIESVLLSKIGVRHLIIGYDHRFGLNRAGDIDFLLEYQSDSFGITEIIKQTIDDNKVSSTIIRKELLDGNAEKANELLTTPYIISGTVTRGSQIAGQLGYPTANCKLENKAKLIPASGTYAATASIGGDEYQGMLYIGTSPTLQGLDEQRVEIHLFTDKELHLYHQTISISVLKKIRGDQKFNTKEELIFNIEQDAIETKLHFAQSQDQDLVKIAILNYNGKHHLETYLPSYQKSNHKNIVVIDNASTDDSVDFLKSNYPDIEIVETPSNLGFTGGYNYGLQYINSKYVAIINSDIRVTDDWLLPMIDILESNDRIAAVQPKILSDRRPSQFEYAGAAGGFMDRLGYPYCRGRILHTVEEDQHQYDEPIEIHWASGAAMLARTDLFKIVGGFDDHYFAHMEEIDLCWRWRSLGYKIMQCPDTTVYHLGGGTLQYDHPRKTYLNLRNNYWMLRKNINTGRLISILPFRILIDLAYAFLFLLKGRVSHFASALKGIYQGLFQSKGVHANRSKLNYLKKRENSIGGQVALTKVTVPISYFLLRKKKYSQL